MLRQLFESSLWLSTLCSRVCLIPIIFAGCAAVGLLLSEMPVLSTVVVVVVVIAAAAVAAISTRTSTYDICISPEGCINFAL